MTPFVEKQRFRQWWFLLSMLLPIAVMWGALVYQIILGETFGGEPGAPDWLVILLWAFFGVLFPAFMLSLTLITRVDESGVNVRFFPLPIRAQYRYDGIDRHEAIEYRPIREFGGWGIRWGGKGKRVWSVSGSGAVRLYLDDGRQITIGTLLPQQLELTIQNGEARSRP